MSADAINQDYLPWNRALEFFMYCKRRLPAEKVSITSWLFKLCAAVLVPLPSVVLNLPEMQKQHLFIPSVCVCSWGMRMVCDGRGRESCRGGLESLSRSLWSGKAPLRGLDVPQGGSRTSVQMQTTSVPPWGCQQRFRQIFQKMNLSARVAFGNGRLVPKHVYFTVPQLDFLRKSNRSSGGKKRMMFSLRCRLGIIRGRTTGKIEPLTCLILLPQITSTNQIHSFTWYLSICFLLLSLFFHFLLFSPNLQLDIFATRWWSGQFIIGSGYNKMQM